MNQTSLQPSPPPVANSDEIKTRLLFEKEVQQKNRKNIALMWIFFTLGFVLFLIPIVGLLCSILTLVYGIKVGQQARKHGRAFSINSFMGISLSILFILVGIAITFVMPFTI